MSPSAAKIGAVFSSLRSIARELSRLTDISLYRRHLRSPAFLVASIRLRAARRRNPLETRFHNGQQGPIGDLLEFEDYQSRWLAE